MFIHLSIVTPSIHFVHAGKIMLRCNVYRGFEITTIKRAHTASSS